MKNLLLFLVIAIQPILAQKANVAQPFSVTSIQINIKKNTPQLVDLPGNATSFVLELNQNTNIGNTTIKTDSETFIVKRAAHQGDTQNNTELIVFEKAITSFTITSDALEGTFSAKSIYVTPIAIDNNYSNARLSADCPKPEVIPISTWRAGLTPPKELPVQSVVKHVIVHHAAGSNTNTNYVDVVRNIYVFHTASNGWNDVGYNFLIAQDGTIFEGRDGQKIADGDNVIGAHFCSQNTGTMGICLLGDYMLVQPPQKAIDALAKLIAWKEAKEKIDPLARTIHVASGKNLFNISAHRDGSCSTDCPGDNLYVKLAEIRQNTVAACADGTVVVVPPPVVVPIVTGEIGRASCRERV